MGNIIRKNDGGSVTHGEWDPFRAMREVLRWDPFRELAPVAARAEVAFSPDFEVKETKDGYSFKADLPGVKESDIEVSLHGNRLSVAGRRDAEQKEQGDTYYTYERTYGAFTRVFTLPDGADTEHMQAELKDGVLSIAIPKRGEMKARKIAISSGTPAKH